MSELQQWAEQLERERDEARARLARVEPVVEAARAFDLKVYSECPVDEIGTPCMFCRLRAAFAALDAAPPSSEPTKPPAPAGTPTWLKCIDCGQTYPPNYNRDHRTRQGEWCSTPSGDGSYRDPTAATSGEVPPLPGELCTCGRPAVTVFVTEKFGRVGYCGSPDGGGGNDVPKEPIEPPTAAAGTGHESARLEITRLERGNIDLAADLAAEREKVERMTGALEAAVELLDTLRHWGHENNCKSEDDQPCNCVLAENDRVSIAARAALAGTAGK